MLIFFKGVLKGYFNSGNPGYVCNFVQYLFQVWQGGDRKGIGVFYKYYEMHSGVYIYILENTGFGRV